MYNSENVPDKKREKELLEKWERVFDKKEEPSHRDMTTEQRHAYYKAKLEKAVMVEAQETWIRPPIHTGTVSLSG